MTSTQGIADNRSARSSKKNEEDDGVGDLMNALSGMQLKEGKDSKSEAPRVADKSRPSTKGIQTLKPIGQILTDAANSSSPDSVASVSSKATENSRISKEDAIQAALEALRSLSLGKPEVPSESTAPPLRPYQQILVDGVLEKFRTKSCPSILLYLPTGGGKTAVAASIARELKRRTAVFVHRDELALQMRHALVTWGFEEKRIGMLKGGTPMPSQECSIVIVSIQTFSRRFMRQNKTSEVPPFELIIIDEAHHAMANEYLTLIQLYPSTQVLGLTATPFRLNKGELLGDIFFDRLDGPSIRELILDNYLVPPVFIRSSVSRGTLGRQAARQRSILQSVVTRWVKHYSTKRTLAFCIDVEHANVLAECFREAKVETDVITGKADGVERERIFTRSREGETKVICSIDVVSEGVDTTWIECLMLLRPTDSRSLFIQQVGRGLRPFANKDMCLILDEVGNVFHHGFIDDVVIDASTKKKTLVFDCATTGCMGFVEEKYAKCLVCQRRLSIKTSSRQQKKDGAESHESIKARSLPLVKGVGSHSN